VARALADAGVDAVQVSDAASSRVRMSGVALAHLIQSQTGMEAVLHFACRDRNIAAIQAELLGAAALGLRSVVAVTGDPGPAGDWPRIGSVFDVNATGLVRIIHGFNHGYTMSGNDIGRPTEFRIGVVVNPAADDLDAEMARFHERLEAGVHFAQTRPLFDLDLFEQFWKRFEPNRVPLLVGVLPLTSARHAEFLHNEVPGITIPDAVRHRLRQAEDRGEAVTEGQRITSEFIRQIRNVVAGVYVTPQSDHVAVLKEVMAEAAVGAGG
jgi:homocysteine S-methyltransferase